MECIPKLRDDKITRAIAMWEGMTIDQQDLDQLNLDELPNLIESLALRMEQPHVSGPAGDQEWQLCKPRDPAGWQVKYETGNVPLLTTYRTVLGGPQQVGEGRRLFLCVRHW